MRHLTNIARAKALDSEFDIQCRLTGNIEIYDLLRKYSSSCELFRNENPKRKRSFWIMKPFETEIKEEKGIKLIVNVLGGPKGCPLPTALKLKEFCEFTEGDFAFLRYLGSAVVNLEQEFVPYRSFLVAPRRVVQETLGMVQAEEYELGMVLLGDSSDAFI